MGREKTLALVPVPTSGPAAAKTGGSATALAPGFRFHPTDEELVSYYLTRKVSDKPVRFNAIAVADIYKHEPWDLSDKSRLKTRDQEWYFFKQYWTTQWKPICTFVEAEWDDASETLVPGLDAGDDGVAGNDAIAGNDVVTAEKAMNETNVVQMIGVEQETRFASEDVLPDDEIPRESPNVRTDYCIPLPPCKVEKPDDCPPVCVLNREAPLPMLQYKRRRHNDSGLNHTNASKNSTRTTQDRCSSTTTTAATATMSPSRATTTAVSALLEFSLMESLEPRQNRPHVPPPVFDTANLDSVVPPGCMKLINKLQQNEIHKISVERETLKLEMMSAQAMINILQSRIDYLSKENEDLSRSNRGT
ncbi:hypothetical protein GQ457_HM001320 [Hibiscus cannabinus]